MEVIDIKSIDCIDANEQFRQQSYDHTVMKT